MKHGVVAERNSISDDGKRTDGWVFAYLSSGRNIGKRMNARRRAGGLIKEGQGAREVVIGILRDERCARELRERLEGDDGGGFTCAHFGRVLHVCEKAQFARTRLFNGGERVDFYRTVAMNDAPKLAGQMAERKRWHSTTLQNLTFTQGFWRVSLGMDFRNQLRLSRRGFIIGSVGLAGALRAMPSSPACVLTSEQEEGPFYVDYKKVRSDITEGKPGVPLQLKIALVHARRCTPLANAALDIWHCDASGVYSAFTQVKMGPPPGGGGPGGRPPGGPPPGGPPPEGFGPPPGMGGHHAMDETRFLRGIQATDSNGMAEFATIYPGWYQGRTIHIHLKVHADGHVAHTGQLFFPEDITDRIAKLQPYVKHQDLHLTTQAEDHVFQDEHGAPGLMTLSRLEARSDAAGFVATVTVAVDPEATPAPVGMGGPGGPPDRH